jgi:hypothetical protein
MHDNIIVLEIKVYLMMVVHNNSDETIPSAMIAFHAEPWPV